MDPLASKIIQKVDQLAAPTAPGFLPTIVARMTGLELSDWPQEGRALYGSETAAWEKEQNLVEAFSRTEASRRMANLLEVISKANKHIEPGKPFAVEDDDDVFWGLLEYAKEVSSGDVQDVIARIIAAEYEMPGMLAKSTLQTLKSLGKRDLQRLAFFGSFYLPEYGFLRHFFGLSPEEAAIRTKLNIEYSDFLELQSLGLVQPRDYTFAINLKEDAKFELKTWSETLVVRANKTLKDWDFPRCYKLTTAGEQIMRHLEIRPCPDFIAWLKQYFKKEGLEVMDITDIDP